MRTTRVILIARLSATIMPAAVLFYFLACSAPPYHPALASAVTSAYLVVSVGVTLLRDRARSARPRLSGLAWGYRPAASGVTPLGLDPPRLVRATRRLLVAVAVITGLVLVTGFSHGLSLRDCTTPVPGWPRTMATVTQVYQRWSFGFPTYAAVAKFSALGHTIYFTAPQSADPVQAGDQIRITYEPGNPYLLHDLSARTAIRKYPLYAPLIALIFVLMSLVAGLTVTDQKRMQQRSGMATLSARP